jgi:hypothetical protein
MAEDKYKTQLDDLLNQSKTIPPEAKPGIIAALHEAVDKCRLSFREHFHLEGVPGIRHFFAGYPATSCMRQEYETHVKPLLPPRPAEPTAEPER